jgi:peptidylprolyl isomerase
VPAKERLQLQALRTDSKTFARLVEANRDRHDAFYKDPPERISICNVPLPIREAQAAHLK